MRVHSRIKKKTHPVTFLNIIIGILFLIFLISLGLIVAINFRPLYYANIKWLNLEASTGLSSNIIRLNYDALIDYNSPFFSGELSFPTLPASASGLSHFVEVKQIFMFFYIAGLISMALLAILIIYKKRKDDYQYLLTSSITTVVIPLILLIFCIFNFNTVFLLFHKIVFRNDDWLFDPVTDPIINLLPESYFMQCAFIIIGFVLIGSIIQFMFYLHKKKSHRTTQLIHPKFNYYY